jgi:hypothetical protein
MSILFDLWWVSKQHRTIPITRDRPAAMTQPLFHLGYVSTETCRFEADDLVSLLNQARAVNASRDLTGILLYREGSFFQVLEGDQAAVQQTFRSIAGDDRHHEIEVLFSGPTEEREFSDWRMGFLNLDGLDIDDLQGYSSFLDKTPEARILLEDLSRGRRLALMFKSMR